VGVIVRVEAVAVNRKLDPDRLVSRVGENASGRRGPSGD
jgi:hypothetical protein